VFLLDLVAYNALTGNIGRGSNAGPWGAVIGTLLLFGLILGASWLRFVPFVNYLWLGAVGVTFIGMLICGAQQRLGGFVFGLGLLAIVLMTFGVIARGVSLLPFAPFPPN
jgi:hypothetical protein